MGLPISTTSRQENVFPVEWLLGHKFRYVKKYNFLFFFPITEINFSYEVLYLQEQEFNFKQFVFSSLLPRDAPKLQQAETLSGWPPSIHIGTCWAIPKPSTTPSRTCSQAVLEFTGAFQGPEEDLRRLPETPPHPHATSACLTPITTNHFECKGTRCCRLLGMPALAEIKFIQYKLRYVPHRLQFKY